MSKKKRSVVIIFADDGDGGNEVERVVDDENGWDAFCEENDWTEEETLEEGFWWAEHDIE
tara:strand:- start:318 stop:497 length:180 start_codon:yes stop_codon:yes gene_type:complete